MSSGMNVEQAKEYAKTMTYKQAVSNIGSGKFIKYRKATMIKLRELAEIADRLDDLWVPCEQRLPSSDDSYLVTWKWINETYDDFEVGIDEYRRGEWVETPRNYKVIAWRPKPSSYKPKEARPDCSWR